MKDCKILFNFPSKDREHKFEHALEYLYKNIKKPHDCFILIKTCGEENEAAYRLICNRVLNDHPIKWALQSGTDTSKVNAVNKGIQILLIDWDILVAMSDDMFIQYNGFDNVIRDAFEKHFPDLDGCLHFYDGYREDIITFPVLGRNYYKRFGYIYHPDYTSLYCDNEMTEVAKKLDKYVFIKKPLIVRHQHPNNTKKQKDELYLYNDSPEMYKKDREVFERRQQINFGL